MTPEGGNTILLSVVLLVPFRTTCMKAGWPGIILRISASLEKHNIICNEFLSGQCNLVIF